MALLKRSTPVEKAFAEHAKAVETVAKWQTEQSTKAAELADLEARIGSEVLDDETAADRLAEQAAKLRSQIDVAGRTAAAASSRVVEAGRAVLKAYAAELKANADHLKAQADQRQTKTDKLLAELSEWEDGAKYVVWEPTAEIVQSAGSAGVTFRIPKTHRLRNQAMALERKVAEYELVATQTPETVAYMVAKLAEQPETPQPAKPQTAPQGAITF